MSFSPSSSQVAERAFWKTAYQRLFQVPEDEMPLKKRKHDLPEMKTNRTKRKHNKKTHLNNINLKTKQPQHKQQRNYITYYAILIAFAKQKSSTRKNNKRKNNNKQTVASSLRLSPVKKESTLWRVRQDGLQQAGGELLWRNLCPRPSGADHLLPGQNSLRLSGESGWSGLWREGLGVWLGGLGLVWVWFWFGVVCYCLGLVWGG